MSGINANQSKKLHQRHLQFAKDMVHDPFFPLSLDNYERTNTIPQYDLTDEQHKSFISSHENIVGWLLPC